MYVFIKFIIVAIGKNFPFLKFFVLLEKHCAINVIFYNIAAIKNVGCVGFSSLELKGFIKSFLLLKYDCNKLSTLLFEFKLTNIENFQK